MLLMELAQHGSLAELVHNPNVRPLALVQQLTVLRDVARGMAYLHALTPPLLHHDLKPSNVLPSKIALLKLLYGDSMNSVSD